MLSPSYEAVLTAVPLQVAASAAPLSFPRHFNHGVTSWSVITFSLQSQSLLHALWPKQDYARLTPRTEAINRANLGQDNYKGKRSLLSGK